MLSKKQKQQYLEAMQKYADEEGMITFQNNPKIDYLFGIYDYQVPTKQDAFKPIEASFIDEEGKQHQFKKLYVKNEDSSAIKDFTSHLRQIAKNTIGPEQKIRKPNLVEVIINVATLPKRFHQVDVDNLAKCVLDALNGIAFDDDSQVSRLLCEKFVHVMEIDSLLIAITKLTEERNGIIGNITLYSTGKWED